MNGETATTIHNNAQRPSLLSANLLYVTGMAMVLFVGSAMQQWHFGWGLLFTELLIGALALLWTRLNRLPWRATLRLNPATLHSLLLAIVMGIGLWLLDTWLGAIMSLLLGYDVPVPPGIYPQNVAATMLLFAGLALGAPLGEELFFRGYMQRAYERLRPLSAIVLVALLFALFHLSLVGLPPRVPVALALGYVAWRSGSLWPGVALHLANNAMAVLMLAIIGLQTGLPEPLTSGAFAVGGPLMALFGLLLVVVSGWLFQRSVARTTVSTPATSLATAPVSRRRWLAALPILVALVLYGGVATMELMSGRFPELLALEPLALKSAPWSEETTWQYRVQHPGDETVGEATCTVTPLVGTATLQCNLHHEPFEVRVGSSIWAGGDFTRRFTVVYGASETTLQQVEDAREFGDMGYVVTAEPQGDSLLLQVEGQRAGEGSELIPPTAMVDELWPWQLSALSFVLGLSYDATVVYPQKYDPELERNVLTVTDTAVVVGGVEPLSVPAGDFFAWRVEVDDETAWYDAEPPHTLLQYDSGPIIWQLTQNVN